MRWVWPLALAFAGSSSLAYAEQPVDGVAWLDKIVSAAQKLNYSGTFTYSSGSHLEISRITHVVDASGEREKLEVLDGSPREVIRVNNEVKCYLPEERTLIIDQSARRRAFPARLSDSRSSVTEFYRASIGDMSRVAGRDSRLLTLDPKDNLRYGHQLWADAATGLLLRARMVGDRGEAIEQFVFTDVTIGPMVDKEKLKSSFSGNSADWRIVDAKATDSPGDEVEWVFRSQLPGYRQSTWMRRKLQANRPEAFHVVFSDGLAAISVFVEPLKPNRQERVGIFASGPFNVYKRNLGDFSLTLLGEVPLAALKLLGDGIEQRRK
ncbi:MAG: MucB/RseB C-terminal domain-containing protein [Sterolibacteriaceae bacterium]|nr:MucB/RseB C-terminal domain-containing protein [Sterolibacteriaceae bacterium]MBK9084375.1 MucB/RseB C-terminal domain-containing protein [Sterolibacteriaceae bacterium]